MHTEITKQIISVHEVFNKIKKYTRKIEQADQTLDTSLKKFAEIVSMKYNVYQIHFSIIILHLSINKFIGYE